MEDRGSWKIGLITLGSLVGIFVVVIFLVPKARDAVIHNRWSFYIVFDDVGGLQQAEKVQLDGVDIGDVSSVELITSERQKDGPMVQEQLRRQGQAPHPYPFALVKVQIRQDIKGELFDYYGYQVGASSLIGTNHVVTITPASPPVGGANSANVIQPGEVVYGTAGSSLSDLAKPAGQMMSSITQLTKQIQNMVAGPQIKQQMLASLEEVHAAATNVRLASDQVRLMSTQMNSTFGATLPKIGNSVDNVEAMTDNFRTASDRMPGMMDQLQGTLVTTSRHTDAAIQNIDAATGKIRTFVVDSGTLDQLHDTVSNLNTGTAHLTSSLSNIQDLTSTPAFKQDLPAIIHNLKGASEQLAPTLHQARETLSTVNSVGQSAGSLLNTVHSATSGGGKKSTAARPPRQALGLQGGIGFLYSRRTNGRFTHAGIVDPEAQFTLGRNNFYLGLYDLGGANRVTAEVGQRLYGNSTRGVNVRYGVYRGFAGLGGDLILGPRLGLYGTMYDANAPTFDLESVLDVSNVYAFWAGIDELNRAPRTVIGFRVKP